jgi:hypothetical protein
MGLPPAWPQAGGVCSRVGAGAHLFVADACDSTIVGTASAVQHIKTGWIGLVFVAPAGAVRVSVVG